MPSLDELLPLELAPQTPMALLALLRQPALWTPPDSEAVAEARSHRIDALLGLRPVEREAARPAARRGVPTALGEASHSRPWGSAATVALLSTPYATLEAIFQELALPAGARVIDLGAGYGRVGFYLALRQPALSFYGLEIVAARVAEARRVAAALGLAALHFAEQDLADAALRLPAGDVYFMYQPVNDETQARLLEQLAALAQSRPLTLVACSDPLQEELHERVRWLRRTRLLRTGTTSRRVVGLFQS